MNCKNCRTLCSAAGRDQELFRDCDGYLPIRNENRLRNMSNEQLAEFLAGFFQCPKGDRAGRCVAADFDCEKCWLNWLGEAVDGGR